MADIVDPMAQMANLKEEIRQLDRQVARSNELLYETNNLIKNLLDKVNALTIIGQLAGGFLKGKH